MNHGLLNLPEEEYRKLDAFNSSSIKLCDRSPYLMDLALQGKYHYEQKQSFAVGTHFHSFLFEPDDFKSNYFFQKRKYDGRVKKDKAERDEEQLRHGNKIPIPYGEAETLKRMKNAVMAHPKIEYLLSMKGMIEVTLSCYDEEFDINRKGRTDYLIKDHSIIDLKSTKDSTPKNFRKDFIRYGYDIQAAWYVDMYKILFGVDIEYGIIAIDKSNYLPYLYEITKETIEEGRKKYKELLVKYFEYKRNPEIIYDVVPL